MLLSFKASVFPKLVSGEKIFEHRKVFPNESIEAYLYVSSPIKAIVGIVYLDNRVELKEWERKYSYSDITLKRIREYLKTDKYAMEISSFQLTNKITLQQLREDLPKFIVPQMYYYLDNTELLSYLEKNIYPVGERVVHDFSDIRDEQICIL